MVTSVVIYISSTSIRTLQEDIMRYRLEVIKEYSETEYSTLERVNLDTVQRYSEQAKERVFEFVRNTEVPGGYFLIIDSESELIFHSIENVETHDLPPNTAKYLSNHIGSDEILRYEHDERTYLSVFDYFEPWDWFILVVVDREIIFENVDAAINLALLTSAAAIVIAVVVMHFITKGVSKPIEELTEGTVAMAKGNYDIRVPSGRGDEFGELAGAFNRMAEEIEDNFKQIQTKSESLSLLASFAAGMSHDIKTPIGNTLTVISFLESELGSLQETYDNDLLSKDKLERFLGQSHESIDIITKNINQATELVTSFKTVSVDQLNREKRWIELKEYIIEIQRALKPRLKNTKHQIIISSTENIHILTYPGAISQIVTNLIVNSLVHGFENVDEGVMEIELSKVEGDIILIYRDNGIGISKDHLHEIYNAFFTTKHDQGGSGLGMHIIYNLVKSLLNGSVDCISEVGKGVEFTIIFPDESVDSNI